MKFLELIVRYKLTVAITALLIVLLAIYASWTSSTPPQEQQPDPSTAAQIKVK